ncbi:Fructose-1,6-bisphosphatase, GlpX type [Euzebya pacifica]|uniref:Fructose-1,6-bisphosphatase n=1 Tax=Euzebya pacifica TaxID=1608957 RepID=A0A346Y248_9ACTN|nr:class II fructose-bisphosphatase [Euzebya pacifica]AXV08545.1 Fructose-1,6-bisphosphatase, GlpX type [Euzebya pacifica]
MTTKPDRNLALELVRATEAAAIAAGRWMGRNNKEAGDQAAVDAMRQLLDTVDMDGVVVIGEGEKDEAPMLFNGEEVGSGNGPQTDIAVDPIDGTRLLAQGRPGSLAVLAMAPRGTMFNPGPMVYMNKWIVGADAKGAVDIDAPIKDNLARIAKAKGKAVNDLTVMMLDRDRHAGMAQDVRDAGARLRLIMDGDVAGGLLAAMPDKAVDVLIGIGGTPEGVTTACAIRALDGEMLGRLWARNDEETVAANEQGYDLDEVLTTERLVSSQDTFFVCTGVTTGDLVPGVNYTGSGVTTDSLCMRGKSGTVRYIRAIHTVEKLRELGAEGA